MCGVADSSSAEDSDADVSLLGSVVWDVYQEYEQLEALRSASQSNAELGFEKVLPTVCISLCIYAHSAFFSVVFMCCPARGWMFTPFVLANC